VEEAYGQGRAPSALHFIALLEDDQSQRFSRRVKYSYEKILKLAGRRINNFLEASLEAYLLSPLMGEWPKLIQKRSENSERPIASSSGAPLAANLEEHSAKMSAPAIEPSPAAEAVLNAKPSPAVEVALDAKLAPTQVLAATADAAEVDFAEYEDGDLVKVKGISAPGNPGYRSVGMPSAFVVEYRGGGVYLVSQAVTTPELPYGSRRQVFAHQLTRLKQRKTVGDSVDERSGSKNVSLIAHKKGLVEAQEATRVAEKKATRACIAAETAEARRQTEVKKRKTESKKRMRAEDEAEVRSLEMAAMASGGTPDNPRLTTNTI